ncbi:hypothetical protein BD410DRAFT_443671 [Rickenella mellea]|uniref:Uncharacterized protein n=1 Tax=Rickenella mellea TaxID=50990 RepID=A0A4Y7PV33_9AGAM|nr:hypothetical protein BD410DRAFT_443671 [Rickenella mellea]
MHGLDDFLTLLTRVKDNGWDKAFPEDRYFSSASQNSDPPYSEPLLSLRRDMEEARVCLKASNEAQRRLKERLRFLRRLSKPLVLQDGIKRLPDDVLAIFFEMGHRTSEVKAGELEFGLSVSRVSRRFRRISLRTPLLWRRFRNDFGKRKLREFISRSGQLDLDVDLDHWSRIPAESFLKLMGETSHRWSSLIIPTSAIATSMTRLGITNLRGCATSPILAMSTCPYGRPQCYLMLME